MWCTALLVARVDKSIDLGYDGARLGAAVSCSRRQSTDAPVGADP
jgi:hypothetical protein